MLVSVILPVTHLHLAAMLYKNFSIPTFNFKSLMRSDIVTIFIPKWEPVESRFVFVNPDERVTCVGGIDYYGELKMSVLRMAMEIVRRDMGGLGVHAGSKTLSLFDSNSQNQRLTGLVFGLSGTGKTSLCCYDHPSFAPDERSWILQDDVNFVFADGVIQGSEKYFYVKCDNCPEHTAITKAVLSPTTIIENVSVKEGEFDWKDFSHTKNTRAITSVSQINVNTRPTVSFILLITRRPLLPPIGKLSSASQAAAYYALGESIITSAENSSLEGTPKRQFGFDPFIIGDYHLNAEFIEKFVENTGVDVYLVNTGYVGNEEEGDITVEDTVKYWEAAIRGMINWVFDEDLRYNIPSNLENKHSPRKFYGEVEYKLQMDNLRNERRLYLESYNLPESIVGSV
jgi:phosphoenolpyruvate carboxykinase (ATP)